MLRLALLCLALCGAAPAAAAEAEAAALSVTCPASTYYWGEWNGRPWPCIRCPAGRTSAGCAGCAPDPSASRCVSAVACPVGKFASGGACTSCPVGKWANAKGSSSCHKCPAGFFQYDVGAHACYYCPSGKYTAAARPVMDKCDKCACKAGFFGATAPVRGATGAAQCTCTGCPAGQYTAANYLSCFDCPAGRFAAKPAAGAGNPTCTYCPAGKFGAGAGGASCAACPAGRTTSGAQPFRECGAALATYTAHFRVFDYQYKSVLAKSGWTLVGAPELGAYQPLLLAALRGAGGGLQPLGSWSSSSCCLTLAGGARVTAGGSYVYPIDGAGKVQCTASGAGTFSSGQPYGFAYQDAKAGLQHLAGVSGALGAAAGTGAYCGARAGERNPGVYLGFGSAAEAGATCVTLSFGRVCLPKAAATTTAPPTTARPTAAPTPSPVDCALSAWGAWGPCSAECGTGARTRARVVAAARAHGGSACAGALSESGACNERPCPIDCRVGAWSTFGTCSQRCGGGTQARALTVLRAAAFGGKACPATREARACNPAPCAVDCQVSGFGDWSTCPRSCGGARQVRTRNSLRDAAHGGQACPPLVETRSCGTAACPVDCSLSQWGGFGACSRSCGTGHRLRFRSQLVAVAFGGLPCGGQLRDSEACATQTCPTDCLVGAWAAWTPCPVTCGGSVQMRFRGQLRAPAAGGVRCPAFFQQRTCGITACPVDCLLSSWGAWGACDATCGGSTQARARFVLRTAAHGGARCAAAHASRPCGTAPCPLDCTMGQWSVWSGCTRSCDLGARSRRREVTRAAAFGGKACGHNREDGTCNARVCPVDCVLSPFAPWGACSASCGSGTTARARRLVMQAAHGGRPCGSLTETKACSDGPCPVHCTVSAFSAWTRCDQPCGSGTQRRARSVLQKANAVGSMCPFLAETRTCNEAPCAVDCVVGDFSSWSTCSFSCGGGSAARARSVVTAARHGGTACPALKQTRSCATAPCPVDCSLSAWSAMDACTKTCGGGTRQRTKRVLVAAAYGGKRCATTHQLLACNDVACPRDCIVTDFTAWSACSASCGRGISRRTRAMRSAATSGGKACGALAEQNFCESAPCPVDCSMAQWASWGACSHTCGGGATSRHRSVARQPAHGGARCAAMRETVPCNVAKCPRDCAYTSWGEWGACSHSCGLGARTRARTMLLAAAHGGKRCAAMAETASCNEGQCPLHCLVSVFGAWSACSKSCGGGAQRRERTVVARAASGGSACPFLVESRACEQEACPVDCAASAFGAWGECDASCGSGARARARRLLRAAQHGGKACPPMREEQSCNTQACPVDCAVTDFGLWSVCSATCGGGARKRFRSVNVEPEFGGEPCPPLSAREPCNAEPCPVDCVLSAFAAWSPCTATCGGGSKHRTREVSRAARFGGKPCAPLLEKAGCGAAECPVDCAQSAWTPWSACSATCHVGTRARSRRAVVRPAFGGLACGATQETTACNDGPCPVHCTTSAFGAWTKCTKTCGGGVQKRSRSVVQRTAHGGSTCPFMHDERSCNSEACPVDCAVAAWKAWSQCPASCGGSQQFRARSVSVAAAHGGKKCPALAASRACNVASCPTDCALAAFGAWAACSASCGTGRQTRVAAIGAPATHGGAACPPAHEARSCSAGACPIDCVLSVWGSYGPCSRTCGSGTHARTRTVVTAPAHGGKACTSTTQSAACAALRCPVDCVLASWGAWTACSKSCGSGFQTRVRALHRAAAFGGKGCATRTGFASCKPAACPVDCLPQAWGVWSECSKSCGTGQQTRTRGVARVAQHGGRACAPAELRDSTTCSDGPCPVHCTVGAFSPWSPCTTHCGGGQQTRGRAVLQKSSAGGNVCPFLKEARVCNVHACPVDCVLSRFSAWGACSQSCNSGSRARVRSVVVKAQHGGKACAPLKESQECSAQKCPVDCVVATVTSWSKCTKSCGMGTKERTRSIDVSAAYGGVACPPTVERAPCSAHACPEDCVSAWGTWSVCSQSCGGGQLERASLVSRPAAFGGKPCAAHIERRVCAAEPCPVDCELSAWSPYSACSKSCGTGYQMRKRQVLVAAAHGGAGCGASASARACPGWRPCPVDCTVGVFAPWSKCTVSCGGGSQTRKRLVTKAARVGGKPCPALSETRACATSSCPVDCVLAQWSAWGACSITCGGTGTATRTRTIVSQATNGGYSCAHFPMSQKQDCNDGACPVHCEVSSFGKWSPCTTSCGGGSQSRSRDVLVHSKGGYQCPELAQTRQCNDFACPTDCVQSDFAAWSDCSQSCGGGARSRTRRTDQRPAYGGKACGAEMQTESCNTHLCPVDCVAAYSAFGACATSCGPGTQQRRLVVSVAAAAGGSACPALTDDRACNDGPCPVSCALSAWGSFGACSTTCGGGVSKRSRVALVLPKHGGKPCDALVDVRSCQTFPCPVHCEVSDFSAWSSCSVSCGGGFSRRTRAVQISASHGGEPCPALMDVRACGTKSCPVDCVLSAWTAWGACSLTCGTGVQQRKRSTVVAAAHGGKACPALKHSRRCATWGCPVNCALHSWGEWSACSKSCAGGTRSRARAIAQTAAHGGKACSVLAEHEKCETGNCPVHCAVTPYTAWGSCSHSCGGGTRFRVRRIQRHAADGGYKCPSLRDTQECNNAKCAVDCKLGAFSPWSACSVSCGGGSSSRSRSIERLAAFGGVPCQHLSELRDCAVHSCPVDCLVSLWSAWTDCSQSCGGGIAQRSRSVARDAEFGGKACPIQKAFEPCATGACPQDCVVAHWSEWSACSETCGGGVKRRTRSVLTPAKRGGVACPVTSASARCRTVACPINCALSDWGPWQVCTKTCGGGMRTRHRSEQQAALFGGEDCAAKMQSEPCNVAACPADCEVGSWSAWTHCSASCGQGFKIRTRMVRVAAEHGGIECPALRDEKTCGNGLCPIHCEVGDFNPWSKCTHSCGGGLQSRKRTARVKPSAGGYQCPYLAETRKCNTDSCPQDCEVSQFTLWSACSATCGGGTRTRTRSMLVRARFGGKACPVLLESNQCYNRACPVDCIAAPWTAWTPCSATCGSGFRARFRTVSRAPAFGGVPCPQLSEAGICNPERCPVDCVMSAWGRWSACSASCAGGTRTRQRSVARTAELGGKKCSALQGTSACAPHACPVDCTLGAWQNWSACSATCGSGLERRSRLPGTAAAHGGSECRSAAVTAERVCDAGPCPVHCAVSAWSPWTPCSATCGGGAHTRSRTVVKRAQHGGSVCPLLAESGACNVAPCPVNCVVSSWSEWSSCSRTCGYGTQVRERNVAREARHGGTSCPSRLRDQRACATTPCPIDCVLSDWGSWSQCTASCGSGERVRGRSERVRAAYGGRSCAPLTENARCSLQQCPQDCSVSAWSAWSSCSRSCDDGISRRYRTIARDTAHGGQKCPELERTELCNDGPCPQECKVSPFSPWSGCSKTCGGGTQTRLRVVLQHPSRPLLCPYLSETRVCGARHCPIDCVVGEFGAWSTCTRTCGGGVQHHVRKLVQPPRYGGKQCSYLSMSRECAQDPCGTSAPEWCTAGRFAAEFSGERTGACLACPAGKFQPSANMRSCSACAAGRYQSAAAATSCLPCAAAVTGGAAACASVTTAAPVPTSGPCSAGQSGATAALCADCAAGTFAAAGALQCTAHTACTAGRFKVGASITSDGHCALCAGGKYLPSGSTECRDCKVGQFKPHHDAKGGFCYFCPVGKYQAEAGRSSCQACAAGQYNALFGSVACIKQPAGSTTQSPATVAPTRQEDCPSGKFTVYSDTDAVVHSDTSFFKQNENAKRFCRECPAGKFMPFFGSRYCEHCEAGQSQPSSGMSSCAACQAGSFSDASSAKCTACEVGRFQSGEGASSCVKCMAGRYGASAAPRSSASHCVLCAVGKHQPLAGQSACSAEAATTPAPTTAAPATTTTPPPTPEHAERAGLYATLRLENITVSEFVAQQHVFEGQLSHTLSWSRHLTKIIEVDGVKSVSADKQGKYSVEHSSGHVVAAGAGDHQCRRFTVNGFTASAQSKRAGDYYFTQNTWGGRPVYMDANRNYIYFHPDKQWWLVGPELGSAVAGMVVPSNAMSPATLPVGKWFVYDDKITMGWEAAPTVRVTCNPVPYVDVKVQLKATGCGRSAARAVEEAQYALTVALMPTKAGLVAAMRSKQVRLMGASLRGKSITRGCAPTILVDVPRPKSAHSLQVHCHYDGVHVSVLHTRPLEHDSFNCYHRYNEEKSAWDCRCHSWDAGKVAKDAPTTVGSGLLGAGPKTAMP